MPIIAMTQEMGSLAKDVALELAQTMNLRAMRHEVVDHLAGKLHMPTSVISRLREGKASLLERVKLDKDRLALYSAEEVFTQANQGNVVLRGWGATCLLRPVPHVVCVRITRSMPNRVRWLMNHLQTDDEEFAEAEIRRSDDAHASRMQQQFGVTWGDPVLYDMVLNTDRLSVQSCVAQIMAMTQRPEFAETDASRKLLADLTLTARVRAQLKDTPETADINITIHADAGVVHLSGIVINEHEKREVERVTAGVAGVSGVHNNLRLMTSNRTFTYSKT